MTTVTPDPWASDLNDWVHDDGTPCAEHLAPGNGTRWWCTVHQQYLKRPAVCEDCGGHCTNGAECAVSQFIGQPIDWTRLTGDPADYQPGMIPERSTEDALTAAGIIADDARIVTEHLEKRYADCVRLGAHIVIRHHTGQP